LQAETCPERLVKEDKEFVIKKFRLAPGEFEKIMQRPLKTFRDYKTNYNTFKRLKDILFYLRRKGLFYR